MPVGPASPPLHPDLNVPATGTPTGPVTSSPSPSQEPPGTQATPKRPAPDIAFAPAAEPREYIVFGVGGMPNIETGEEETWTIVGRATATSKTAARDEIVDTLPENERGGPFVTIAASAWKPQTAKEERDVKPGRTTIRRVWS